MVGWVTVTISDSSAALFDVKWRKITSGLAYNPYSKGDFRESSLKIKAALSSKATVVLFSLLNNHLERTNFKPGECLRLQF